MNGEATFSTATTSAVTLDDVLKALRSVPEEPIAVWMRERGFDPQKGGVLYLPELMRCHCVFPPDYVRFSPLIGRPLLAWVPRMFPPPWEETK